MENNMNIFEQYGGYEVVKQSISNYKQSGDMVTAAGLELQCLEYRRKNNIFEFNDLIVFDNTKEHCTLLPDYIMTYESMFDTDARVRQGGRFFAVSFEAIRHATDEEIESGRRL